MNAAGGVPPSPEDPSLDALSLAEKASLLSGQDFQYTKPLPAAGVPAMQLCDGPHGVRHVVMDEMNGPEGWMTAARPATCFPPAVAVANSWDPQVAARIGTAMGEEARAYGVSVSLGPAMNIKRSPLCGRNFEYYSEDPLITGVLATAHVQGVQGQGVGTSPKHFAANNQETERMQVDAVVDERTLREIYLPAFERVVKQAAPATVMAAYNKVNGEYATQNRWLLRNVLREEWGFTGVVISDWGAVNDRVAALEAGLDLEMPGSGGVNDRALVEAARSGSLAPARIDESARRVADLARRVAGAASGTDESIAEFDREAHHALARQLATECAVLLKNDGATLPLSPGARLAVIGPFAAAPRYQGGGSSHVNATRIDAALEALQAYAAGNGQALTFAPGFTAGATGVDGGIEPRVEGDADLRAAAVEAARQSDVAVIFAGLAEKDESEGFDRTTIELPAEQVALIRAVAAAAPRTVVVLSHGGIVAMGDWHDEVDAILDGFLLGQASGSALADLLVGRANPSGRLAETIPYRLQDNPSYLNFPGESGQVRYGEGVMVGYRYYETVQVPVRYPFGHGLSYTSFAARDLAVKRTGADSAEVSLTVANTGQRAGKHVVQIYVATDCGKVRRPARELRAFTKVALEPGESTTVRLELDRRAFAHYDVRQGDWAVAGGTYAVQLCDNAHDVVAEVSITLPGDTILSTLTLDSSIEEWMAHPVVGPGLIEVMAAGMTPEQASFATDPEAADMMRMIASMPMRQLARFPGLDIPVQRLEDLLTRAATPAR